MQTYDKVHRKAPSHNGPVQKLRFNQQASIIARDVAHTTEMLSKLAVLAKRKPLFDDKPVEIGELTYVIKQDMFKIGKSIQALQQYANGDLSIQVDLQVSQYLKNVLSLLNAKMKNVLGEFKNVLEVRQKNELLTKSRTENFLSAASHRQSSQLPAQDGENPYLHYDDPPVSAPGEYLNIPEQAQLLMQEEGQYLQQRNRAVETIELTINEVGNLFQQLATMVSEQGETIQRIDQNVDDISLNILGAQRELLRYYANISSNRWLFLKIFGVLLVFFLLWVVVS